MKKTAALLLALVLLLAGCTVDTPAPTEPTEPVPVTDPRTMLEFCGLPWDATPEEARAILELDRFSCTELREDVQWNIRAEDFPMFGNNVTLELRFQDDTLNGRYGLFAVSCYFPLDANLPLLRNQISMIYGAPDEDSESPVALAAWSSANSVRQALPQETLDGILALMEQKGMGEWIPTLDDPVAFATLRSADSMLLEQPCLMMISDLGSWLHMLEREAYKVEVGPDFQILRSPEEITPCRPEEMDLQRCKNMASTAAKALAEGSTSFEIAYAAYDPILSDYAARKAMAEAPLENWSESDYYRGFVGITVRYSAAYGPDAGREDVEDGVWCVTFCKSRVDGLWHIDSQGPAPIEDCTRIMDPELLTGVDLFAVAAYEQPNGSITAFLKNPTNGEINARLG